MTRIFASLALLSILLLGLNVVLGLRIGDFTQASRQLVDARRQVAQLERTAPSSDELQAARDRLSQASAQFRPVRQRATLHILLGVAAALVAVLVNSVTVTYFIGTGRWCKEVVAAYALDESLAEESNRLKRRTFPWALLSMLVIIGVVALGAASDPGANFQSSGQWVRVHYLAALLGTLLIGWSYVVQHGYIRRNFEIVNQIMAQVRAARRERGLST